MDPVPPLADNRTCPAGGLLNRLSNRTYITGWPLLALLAAWVAFWWPLITGEQLLFVRDLNLFGAPSKHYLAQRIVNGEFPSWTSLIAAGMPFFADASNQVLYPLNVVFLASPSVQQGITWFVIVHSLLALAGFYALSRAIALPRIVALWASLVYGLSGYVLSMSDNINYLPACAWVPLGLAGALHGLRGSGARWIAMTALCMAMLLLAGDALNATILLAVMTLLCLHAAWPVAGVAGVGRALLGAAAVAGLAVLLTAIQILPTLELSALSVRQSGLSPADLGHWSFPPKRLLEFVQPFFFGSYYPAGEFLGPMLYGSRAEAWANSVYLGPLTVLLAFLALVVRPATAWPWVFTLVLTGLLGFGRYLPGFELLADTVPLLGSQRFPEKLVFWVTLCLCLLAGIGAAVAKVRLAHWSGALSRQSVSARAAMSVALSLLAFFALLDLPGRAWIPELGKVATVFWHARGLQQTHLQVLMVHLAVVLILVVGMLWVKPRWQGRGLGVLLMFTVLDLAWVHHGYVLRAPAGIFTAAPEPAVVRAIRDRSTELPARIYFDDGAFGGRQRSFVNHLTPWILEHYESRAEATQRGYRHLFVALQLRHRLAPNAAILSGIGYLNGRGSPLQLMSHLALERAGVAADPWHLLATSGVEFVVTTLEPRHRRWAGPQFEELLTLRDINVRLLRVANHLPRAFVVDAAEVEQRSMTTVSSILPRVHQGQTRLNMREPAGRATRQFVVTAVRSRHSRPEHHVIDVDSPHDRAWLALTESLYPGWTATVDGEPATLHLMNERFMAVALPAGSHRVEFRFRPTHLGAGLWLSLLGLMLCALLLWRDPRLPGAAARGKQPIDPGVQGSSRKV